MLGSINGTMTERMAPMPSEAPHLPRDSHASLLAGGSKANRHLGLQAYELAEYARPSQWPRRLLRAGITAAVIGCTLAIGTKL
jgi:hypothetical protein